MSFIKGIKYNFKGLVMSLRTPQLFVLGVLRFAVVLILAIVSSGLIIFWHDQILSLIWTMPEPGWLFYLWKIVSWILSITLASISIVISYLISQLFFGVFIMDYMSKITEKMMTGQVDSPNISWFPFFIYLIRQEIPRAVIPVFISLIVMILSLFTPLSPVLIIVSSLIAVSFLAWDNTDLVPARRMFTFRERAGFFKKNILFHLGFGVCFLIPWVNILFLSFAPVGATLYYLENKRE